MTKQELREMIREEIRTALKVMKAEAEKYPDYGTGDIQDAASGMTVEVLGGTLELLNHSPSCELRSDKRIRWSECDCGVNDR